MRTNKLVAAVAASAALAVVAASGLAQAGELRGQSAPNLVERLERLGQFNILLTALDTAGLKETLATGGPFTLFAPTDAAFASLLEELDITAEQLLANPDLASILLYHVTSGTQRVGALVSNSTSATLNGQPVLVVFENFGVRVNRSKVTRANVNASNGIIQVLDKVLLPPADLITIESMLDVLQLDGRFTILLQALEKTGLDDAVASPGPLTLFAPTDAAFATLLASLQITPAQLLENPELSSILLYHVAAGKNGALSLLRAREIKTLQGEELDVRLRRDGVYINDSRVINPNVQAPNGIIHTIDAVLLP